MTKSKMRKLAALAISLVMASGATGIVGYAGRTNSATAFADTANYAVEDESSIGVGIIASNVEVTNTAPATLALEDVKAGSYIISVNTTEEDANTSFDIYAKVGNGEEVKLIFSWYSFAYVGTVNVPEGATSLTLSVKSNIVGEEDSPIKLIVMAELDTLTLHDGMVLSGVGVSYNKPATIDVSDITPGKYVLNFIAEDAKFIYKDENQEDPLPASLAVSLDGKTAYLHFTPSVGAYTTVVTIEEGAETLSIATLNGNSFVFAVRLAEYVISPDTGYTLGGAVISNGNPANIPLVGVGEGNYTIAVDLGDITLSKGATITAKVGDGAEVELKEDGNYISAYTGTVAIGEGATMLTISTTDTETLSVSVSLEKQTPVYELVNDKAVTLNIYEAAIYSYKVEESGYYAITTTNVDVEDAGYDISLKTDVDSFDGTAIHGQNFPVWLEAGTTYYYQVTYTGIEVEQDPNFPEWGPVIPDSPAKATVKLNVHKWQGTPITKSEYTFAPVTISGEAAQEMEIDKSVTAGSYAIALSEVPWFFGMEGKSIYANYNGEAIKLNMNNGYVANITITAEARKIYFTTDSGERLTVGVMFTDPVVEVDDTIELNKAENITIAAGDIAVYYLNNLGGGTYTLTLNLPSEALIMVESSNSDNAIIEAGKAAGEFKVTLPADMASTTVALIFTNNGDKEVSFSATVTPNNWFVLDSNVNISMKGNTSVSYYINLTAGEYAISLNADVKIQVMVNGKIVIGYGDKYGEFTIDEDALVMITFMYVGAEEEVVTFSANMYEN